MVRVDTTFGGNYVVESLGELPASREVRRFYFPGASAVGGRDGVLVKVTPRQIETQPWVGIFAFGLLSPKGVSEIFSCPDPNQLCVVARGAAYVVAAADPLQNEEVDAGPVMGVYPVPAKDVLVFADYLRLIAYGPKGLAWRTARLSWDGLQVAEIDGDWLHGKGWSAPENRHVEFSVNLQTGTHVGGASPD